MGPAYGSFLKQLQGAPIPPPAMPSGAQAGGLLGMASPAAPPAAPEKKEDPNRAKVAQAMMSAPGGPIDKIKNIFAPAFIPSQPRARDQYGNSIG